MARVFSSGAGPHSRDTATDVPAAVRDDTRVECFATPRQRRFPRFYLPGNAGAWAPQELREANLTVYAAFRLREKPT